MKIYQKDKIFNLRGKELDNYIEDITVDITDMIKDVSIEYGHNIVYLTDGFIRNTYINTYLPDFDLYRIGPLNPTTLPDDQVTFIYRLYLKIQFKETITFGVYKKLIEAVEYIGSRFLIEDEHINDSFSFKGDSIFFHKDYELFKITRLKDILHNISYAIGAINSLYNHVLDYSNYYKIYFNIDDEDIYVFLDVFHYDVYRIVDFFKNGKKDREGEKFPKDVEPVKDILEITDNMIENEKKTTIIFRFIKK